MKRSLAVLFVGLAFARAAFCAPTINDLEVTPIEPLGLAIDYTVSGAANIDIWRRLVVTMTLNGKTYTAKSLKGATGNCTNGTHRVYWNMAADGISVYADDAAVEVTYRYPKYCVVDLQGGETATSYPVTYLDEPPSDGFNTREYKTSKVVLKLLDKGGFWAFVGKTEGTYTYDKVDERWYYYKKFVAYQSIISVGDPFYMGLYEVTQKQWELVMGTNVCSATEYGKGDAYPVHYVSYDMIRDSTVGKTSFIGRLRAKTGITFDLPTEAQWEYACYAGATTVYSYGDSPDGEYMWYSGNNGQRGTNTYGAKEVGTRKPNAWGFYDMHGNVMEWCLDWYTKWWIYEKVDGYRVIRGSFWGGIGYDKSRAGADNRGHAEPHDNGYAYGFRIALVYP